MYIFPVATNYMLLKEITMEWNYGMDTYRQNPFASYSKNSANNIGCRFEDVMIYYSNCCMYWNLGIKRHAVSAIFNESITGLPELAFNYPLL